MSDKMLRHDSINKLFIKYTVPAIISMVIIGAQSIISGIFLGKYVGENALASVTLVQPFLQTIIGLSLIVSVGAQSYLGRRLGEGQIVQAQNAFKTALITIEVIGFTLLICGRFFNIEIASLLGANDALSASVSTYVKEISLFAPIMAYMYLFGFINRILGKPELHLKGAIASLIMSVALNYIFVKEMGLGIAGAAVAIGLSQTVAFLIVMVPFFNEENDINVYNGKFNRRLVFPIVYNGSSEGVIAIAIATTAYLFNMTFMKMAGESGVAAFAVISYISQCGTLIIFGVSDGIAPLISFNYGDKNHKRVREILRKAININALVGVLVLLVVYVFGNHLIRLFVSDNQEVIKMASEGAKLYAFAFVFNGFNITYSGYFTAIGNAKNSIIISASRGIVFIVIGITILPMMMPLKGIWLTVPLAEVMTFIVSLSLISMSKEKGIRIGSNILKEEELF